jgi:hypothetical protein
MTSGPMAGLESLRRWLDGFWAAVLESFAAHAEGFSRDPGSPHRERAHS